MRSGESILRPRTAGTASSTTPNDAAARSCSAFRKQMGGDGRAIDSDLPRKNFCAMRRGRLLRFMKRRRQSLDGELRRKHGRADPERPGSGLARVVGLGYAGMSAGPAVIGAVASHTGLRIALAIPLVLALWIAVAAPAISKANAGTGVRDVKAPAFPDGGAAVNFPRRRGDRPQEGESGTGGTIRSG